MKHRQRHMKALVTHIYSNPSLLNHMMAQLARTAAILKDEFSDIDQMKYILSDSFDNDIWKAYNFLRGIYRFQNRRRYNSRRRKQMVRMHINCLNYIMEGDYGRFAKLHIRLHYHRKKREYPVDREIYYSDLRKRGVKKRGSSKKL